MALLTLYNVAKILIYYWLKKGAFWVVSDSVYDKIILLCKIGPKGISLSFKVICDLILKIHHTNVQNSWKRKLSNNIFNLGQFYRNKIKSQNCLICIFLMMIKNVIFKQILNIFQSFQVHLLRVYSFGLWRNCTEIFVFMRIKLLSS